MARQRVSGVRFERLDARRMTYKSCFDLVGAFDVLEHIDDDSGVLARIARSLRRDGGLVLTVPQHQGLWSAADEFARHERRYARSDLVARVQAAGFTLERVTSFVTLLSPLMFLSRVRDRFGYDYDPWAEFQIPGVLDRAFEQVTHVEQRLIARGASLPFGGSLLAVARRR